MIIAKDFRWIIYILFGILWNLKIFFLYIFYIFLIISKSVIYFASIAFENIINFCFFDILWHWVNWSICYCYNDIYIWIIILNHKFDLWNFKQTFINVFINGFKCIFVISYIYTIPYFNNYLTYYKTYFVNFNYSYILFSKS